MRCRAPVAKLHLKVFRRHIDGSTGRRAAALFLAPQRTAGWLHSATQYADLQEQTQALWRCTPDY